MCSVSWPETSQTVSRGCASSPSRFRPSCGRSPADPAGAAHGAHIAGPNTSAAPPTELESLPEHEKRQQVITKDSQKSFLYCILTTTAITIKRFAMYTSSNA